MEFPVTLTAHEPAPRSRTTDDEYKFIYGKDESLGRAVRFCVDAIVIYEGKILLFKRAIEPFLGLWALPGGMQRWREPIDEAFDRILQNEVGIKCLVKKSLGCIDHVHDGPAIHSVSEAYMVLDFLGVVRGSDQGQQFKWFDRIPENTQPYQAAFLRKNWEAIMG